MLKKSASQAAAVPGSSRQLIALAWTRARSIVHRLLSVRTPRTTAPARDTAGGAGVRDADAISTVDATQVPYRLLRFRRFGERLGNLLARRPAPAEFVLLATPDRADALVQLERKSDPKLQLALLTEALELLDEFDRRVIELRLAGDPYDSVAKVLAINPVTAGPRYSLAVDRLVVRLSWVAALERRGISPPERAALGQVRFFGRTAQEVARRLRLNQEAVERWIQLADLSRRPETGESS